MLKGKDDFETHLSSLEDSDDSDLDSVCSKDHEWSEEEHHEGRRLLVFVAVVAVILARLYSCRYSTATGSSNNLFSPHDDRLPLLVALGRNDRDFDYSHHLQSMPAVHDVRTVQYDGQIPIEVASEEIATFINRWGELRNEGMALSPDGRRLAGTSFSHDKIALYTFHLKSDESAVVIEAAAAIEPEGLNEPHGLAFLDDYTLAVSNRVGTLVLIDLDKDTGMECTGSRPVVSQQALDTYPDNEPGNHDVAVRKLTGSLMEVVVCNNFSWEVNRYILDGANDWSIVDGEILLETGLHVPDGMAITSSGEYLAVSNHFLHSVYIYQVTEDLGLETEPVAKLYGIHYPHGLEFVENDRKLLATDAGGPFICAWTAPSGDWGGDRQYTERYRVKDDAAFYSAHVNEEEGGPKGLAVINDHIAVVTSNFQPLSFFNLDRITKIKHDNCPNPDFFNPTEIFLKRMARDVAVVRKERVASTPAITFDREKLLQRRLERRRQLIGEEEEDDDDGDICLTDHCRELLHDMREMHARRRRAHNGEEEG